MAVSGASIPGERVSVSRSMNDGREFAAAADALSANTASQPLEQAPQPPILSVGYHPAVPEIREPAPAVLPHPVKNESAVIDAVHQIVRRYAPKRVDARTLAREIVKEAREQNYDPLFVAAVIKSESAFNALARSHVGARGLMQIMPATGRWLQQTKVDRRDQRGDLTDPGYNLRLGITYLKHLEEMYSGDRVFTLVAYNWGPGRVDRASGGRNKVPREVVQYALKILNDHRRWTAELTT
jgi:soluble lytic murein transglycosylase-like protein